MIFENYFACFESVIPSRICDLIIQDAQQKQELTALTKDWQDNGKDEKDISKLYKVRNSSIVWMEDPWLYREVIPFVRQANQMCKWGFDTHYSEPCQFTKYGVEQHYNWHQDSFINPISDPTQRNYGLIRKLTVTVSLADGDSYEGGDLEFSFRDPYEKEDVIQKPEAARKKGSVTVFPSFVWHRVTPVTQGTRYSLVIWHMGYPFR